MLDLLKRIFGATDGQTEANRDAEFHDTRIAVCALFLEMANADDEFGPAEKEQILTMLEEEFDLSREYAQQVAEEAERARRDSLDLWKFTNAINENFQPEEKIKVVELLWQIVYADGKLEKHEHYLMRKCATLLNLKDSQLIEAKLRVINK